MANFQFGQDNVGGGWGVPSGYMQAMSASPTANAISGIANAIAAASQQYQAARQNEANNQFRSRQLQQQYDLSTSGTNMEQQRIDLLRQQYESQQELNRLERERQRRLTEAALGLQGLFESPSEPSLPQQQQAAPMSESMQLFHPYGLTPANPQYNIGNPSLINNYGLYQ